MQWNQTRTDRIELWGEASLESARAFERACEAMGEGDRTLAMLELDIEEGAACAALVDALRGLARKGKVVLEDAPQPLAHVLYRVGALSRIELVRPRVESPTVS